MRKLLNSTSLSSVAANTDERLLLIPNNKIMKRFSRGSGIWKRGKEGALTIGHC